jgi:hypothetical protein
MEKGISEIGGGPSGGFSRNLFEFFLASDAIPCIGYGFKTLYYDGFITLLAYSKASVLNAI